VVGGDETAYRDRAAAKVDDALIARGGVPRFVAVASRIAPARDGRSLEELCSGHGLLDRDEFEGDERDNEQSDGHNDMAS
jgi:hypothetical protein